MKEAQSPRSVNRSLETVLAAICFSLVAVLSAQAGSATWDINPSTNDWNTAANWTPDTVPNGPNDTATFGSSGKTALSLSADVEVNAITFNPGASAYTITTTPNTPLLISGIGITNNSGVSQKFIVDQAESSDRDHVDFVNSAKAGSNVSFDVIGGQHEDFGEGGTVFFSDNASADYASFEIFGAVEDAVTAGTVSFYDNSTAANATFVVHHGDKGWNGQLNFVGGNAGDATITTEGGWIYFGAVTVAGDAGNSVITNNGAKGNGAGVHYDGKVFFRNTATANHATITNNGGQSPGDPSNGQTVLYEDADAGNATFISNGGNGADTRGGLTMFSYGNTTASNATCIANGGVAGGAAGEVLFSSLTDLDSPTAANAMLIANSGGDSDGGIIAFEKNSDGGTARIEVFGNGNLKIGAHNSPGITTGSLEGDGLVSLGTNNLTLGSNNLSTTFAGVIQEEGSLTKIGTGNLTLTGANTYTGGTTVSGGILLANNTKGSGTGRGPVQVTAGTFGGGGKVSGAVTVGTGSGPGAFLGPGATGVIPGTLTIRKKLTLMADATYKVTVNSSSVTTDKVSAKGVKIRSAQILLDDRAASVLPSGTTFTVINNTAATPTAGTFANLADGSTVVVGNNTFQANYEGGDGNDLTLTVVP